MGKTLVIAEKPSVANDIAKALGGLEKKGDYFEGEKYIVSSAVGHLLEIAAPEEYEVKRGKWTFNHLPVLPPEFDLKVIERTKARLTLLVKLIKRKDVDSLINACDAGREGELIFRYIYQYSKTKKPIERLWLQSMTPQAIREGFTHLRSESAVHHLAEAARCRSEADWLVGINGTRAMTAFNSKTGGFQLTTVGRVQTPTLAILVEREAKIQKFKPKPYWTVQATFSTNPKHGNIDDNGNEKTDAPDTNGLTYGGQWIDTRFEKSKAENPEAKADRLWSAEDANAIVARCVGKPAIVTDETKPSTQSAPLLYDLTTLQREANTRFGFSAKTTLSLAQALYEKHKALTYPRTDARALPEDYMGTAASIIGMFAESQQPLAAGYVSFAAEILKEHWVRKSPRIFNNKKISDHFAIIPTHVVPKSLSDAEAKVYDLVVKRFLSVFYPAAEYLLTTRLSKVGEDTFKTEGKILVSPGWLKVYGRQAAKGEDDIPNLPKNAKVIAKTLETAQKETRPPARYSEATLLSAMEGAGKLVEDEELRAAMSAKGLGTPATRAAIIEGLLTEKYILRNGKDLQPTAKAFSLITLLQGLGIPELCSPELTGNWEYQLSQIEKGEKERKTFMNDIRDITNRIVEQAKNFDSDTVPGDFATLNVPCPKCGGVIKETYKKYNCVDCHYGFWKVVAGRQMEPHEIEQLLTAGETGLLDGFRSKMGRPFSAKIKLNNEGLPEFDFGQPSEGEAAEIIDFSEAPLIGKCPVCKQGNVYAYGSAYGCENMFNKAANAQKEGNTAPACTFRLSQSILQRQITPEEAVQMVKTGRTGLLKQFISKRGRPFSAYLVLGQDGKIGFEFEPSKRAKNAAQSAKETAVTSSEAVEDTPEEKTKSPTTTAKAAKTTRAAKTAGSKTATKRTTARKKTSSADEESR